MRGNDVKRELACHGVGDVKSEISHQTEISHIEKNGVKSYNACKKQEGIVGEMMALSGRHR